MKRVLFIDRDGTIILEPPDEQVDDVSKLQFRPGAISALHRIATEMDYELVMVTNQDGLGTDSFPEDTFWPAHDLMLSVLAGEGVQFDAVHIDRTLPAENAPTRKPGTGMMQAYIDGDYDLSNSFVIGDRETDVEFARNLGSRAIYIGENVVAGAELATTAWDEIYRHLAFETRKSSIERRTHETDVRVQLALDGDGEARIQTGLGFLDHMLSQVARHGRLDLRVEATGDLHVDEHHLVEDVALCLGNAVDEALGDKRGIERYGFVLCMDEALTHMAVDFSGRSYLVWDGEFRRERIGDLPTELIEHFFRSFADTARCNLHVKIEGRNEHHKAESAFKALGKCIRQAARREGSRALPSTKGSL